MKQSHITLVLPLAGPSQLFPRMPREVRVMSEDGQPLLGDRLRVIALAAVDGLQRKEVECHHPREVKVCCGRNQVGDIAGGLSAALEDYACMFCVCPGKSLTEIPGTIS